MTPAEASSVWPQKVRLATSRTRLRMASLDSGSLSWLIHNLDVDSQLSKLTFSSFNKNSERKMYPWHDLKSSNNV